MISDDEYLERIVAGIHEVTTNNATVSWNEIINGRQFDVVVRFTLGTLRYLVLVEVKNKSRRTSASDLDAFVTKARDQNADKAVFVTAAGFQSGAIEVAKRHGVEPFTISFDENDITVPSAGGAQFAIRNPNAPSAQLPEFDIGEPEPAARIESISLLYEDGTKAELPSESSQMTYYSAKTRLADGRTIDRLIQSQPVYSFPKSKALDLYERFTPPMQINPPDPYFFPAGRVSQISWRITDTIVRFIRGNILVDPGLFAGRIVYTHAITGDESRFSFDQLPLGGHDIESGHFYFAYHPLIYYHCDNIENDLVTWTLVESFQNGQMISGRFTQLLKYSNSYIKVTDKSIIARLRKRLADYEGRTVRKPSFPGEFARSLPPVTQ